MINQFDPTVVDFLVTVLSFLLFFGLFIAPMGLVRTWNWFLGK